MDNDNIYFVEPRNIPPYLGLRGTQGVDRLSRCSRLGCAEPTVLLENAGLGVQLSDLCANGNSTAHFVKDQQFLYTAICDPSRQLPQTHIGVPEPPGMIGCGIAVIPK